MGRPAAKRDTRSFDRNPRAGTLAMVHRKIRLRPQKLKEAQALMEHAPLSALAARVLAARGIKPGDQLKNFVSPTLKEGLPEPFKLKGLREACELIQATIESDKPGIGICCDFDVDGLSGGAQLSDFLNRLNVPNEVFVPDRFEDGYGLNEKMVEAIAKRGFSLLICIDYGTTNIKELTAAHKAGLKTIVVDHHHVEGKPPPCDVFINPQQKGCGFAEKILCASGLTWYLVVGLKKTLPQAASIDPREYLELACLGTICDMVPLLGANRVIAKRGLEYLTTTKRPGLMALKKTLGAKADITSFDVSFGIGPRLNAAGRMVHGSAVVELLTTTDSNKAHKVAQTLNELNADRQETEAGVKEVAIEELNARGVLPNGIVIWNKEFHTGVIGIVAQRLVETFYRPSVVLGADKDGVYKGSVRGVKGFSVVAALASCGEHLIKYGGHEGAGGLSIAEENLEAFAAAFEAECVTRLEGLPTSPSVDADTEATLAELSPAIVAELKQFAPFGVGNPGPQLLFSKLRVQEVKVLKDTHLKVLLSDNNKAITGMMWRVPEHPALKVGTLVNVVGKADINSYNGVESLQITIEAVESVF